MTLRSKRGRPGSVILAFALCFAVTTPELAEAMTRTETIVHPSLTPFPLNLRAPSSANPATEGWIEPTPRPLARIGHAVAYDPSSGRTVLFGGLTVGGLSNETWTYNAATKTWREWRNPPPAARQGHAMAYDPGTGLVVLFGGRTAKGLTNETWVLDPSNVTWTRREPPTAPSPRERHEMAYDASSGRIVLFGGWTGTNDGETWLYDVRTDSWTPVSPSPSPSARHDHAMASGVGRVVLFGGSIGAAANPGLSNETWSFDVARNIWTNLTSPASPSGRERHAMASDIRTGRIVLFGGTTRDGVTGDTWRLEPASRAWMPFIPSTGPSPRDDHAMTYDERLGSVVLVCGQTASSPSDEVWLLGGDDTAWTNPLPMPAPRSGHGMVYVPELGRSILFGGWTAEGPSNETWSYNLTNNDWTPLTSGRSPSGRGWSATAYDSRMGRIVLFGGASLRVPPYDNNETWSYDPVSNAWMNMTNPGGPGRREGHAMAYDARAGRFVMFGGYVWGEPQSNETWTYDLRNNTWTNMSPANPPSGRDRHVIAYDSWLDRVILFGGRTTTGDSAETWTYDLTANAWTKLGPTGLPPPSSGSSLIFDSAANRFLLFGGDRPVSPFLSSDTWLFYAQNDTWVKVASTSVPPPRADQALAFDIRANVTVLFGGFTPNLKADDVWWHGTFERPPPPRSLRAIPENGAAALTWDPPTASGVPVTGYRVYRGTQSGIVSVVASVDEPRYNDTGLVNGQTYRYQVSAINAVGEGPQSEEVAVVPFTRTDLPEGVLFLGVGMAVAALVLVGLIIVLRRRSEKSEQPPRPKE